MTVAGLNVTELVQLALMLIAVGAISGFFAGVFGIGGGAILVPVFYECFRLAGVPLEVRMPLCIGTSLAIIIPTSLSSFRAHYARLVRALAVVMPNAASPGGIAYPCTTSAEAIMAATSCSAAAVEERLPSNAAAFGSAFVLPLRSAEAVAAAVCARSASASAVPAVRGALLWRSA